MSETILDPSTTEPLREAWDRFIDQVEPLRPDLFRFGLRLTGNPFDAEDLVHDGLMRAFTTLGRVRGDIRSPRAYLLRILTNLWIDELRRSRPESAGAEERLADPGPAPDQGAHLRDAAERVLAVLTPRERVALVLKESFDLSHAEIARIVSSSEGAVKVALHRGRRRLADVEATPCVGPRVSRELVDRFVDAFRSHDLDALRILLLGTVEAEVFPCGVGVGLEYAEKEGWLRGSFYHHLPEYEARGEPYPKRFEVHEFGGEPVVLVFRDHGRGDALEEVWRLEEDDGRVARIRDYCFSPDLVRWVADALDVPARFIGYNFRERMNEFRDDPV